MAWYNSILGMGNAASAAQQAMSTSATTYSPLAAQAGAITMSTGSSTWSSLAASTNTSIIISILQQYCHQIGWSLEHLYLPNMTSNDPKVAILKLAKENEVIKDVGVRLGDANFYIMREPSGND